MDVNRLVAVIAIFNMAGATHAQQAEFLARNAGFKSALIFAELRRAKMKLMLVA